MRPYVVTLGTPRGNAPREFYVPAADSRRHAIKLAAIKTGQDGPFAVLGVYVHNGERWVPCCCAHPGIRKAESLQPGAFDQRHTLVVCTKCRLAWREVHCH